MWAQRVVEVEESFKKIKFSRIRRKIIRTSPLFNVSLVKGGGVKKRETVQKGGGVRVKRRGG